MLGPEQARATGQRRPLGADLGEGPEHAAAEALDHPGDVRYRILSGVSRAAAVAGGEAVPPFLSEDGSGTLLRRRVPVPDHDVAADQDGSELAVQSQVHRSHPGDLLQCVTLDAVPNPVVGCLERGFGTTQSFPTAEPALQPIRAA